jgi:lycopene cyclase domain-containing protein
MSYLVLDGLFLGAALVVGVVAVLVEVRGSAVRFRALARRWWLPVVIAGVVVLILTAIFDNVLIAAGMFSYTPEHLVGVRVGAAPIEDFGYPIAGLILLPSLWSLTRRRR